MPKSNMPEYTLQTTPAIVSIDFLTNAWVDWSDFLVAHWRYLEEGYLR
jgi:hypothetical protein